MPSLKVSIRAHVLLGVALLPCVFSARAVEVKMAQEVRGGVGGQDRASLVVAPLALNHSALLAQASPPAIITSQPNWLSRSIKDPLLLKEVANSINSGRTADLNTIAYKEAGPLGMPSLTVPLNLDFSPGDTEGNRQHLQLAATACMFLDARIRQAGAWGPECKIESAVSWAKGKLTEDTKTPGQPPGTYWYDPVGLGRDEFRFILTNGAGKQVDVTFVFNVKRAPDDYGQVDQDEKQAVKGTNAPPDPQRS